MMLLEYKVRVTQPDGQELTEQTTLDDRLARRWFREATAAGCRAAAIYRSGWNTPLRQYPSLKKVAFGPAWCLECGNAYQPTRGTMQFCSAECRKTHHNRRVMGGLKLYDLAMKWRIERPTKAWYDLTQMADQLATEEREIRKKRAANIATQRATQKSNKISAQNLGDFVGFSPEQIEAGLTVRATQT